MSPPSLHHAGLRDYTTMLSAYRGSIQRYSAGPVDERREPGPMLHNAKLMWEEMLGNASVRAS